MAVATAKDDRFGAGDTHVTTSRPLMLRPALPRFLRAGDAMSAGVIVTTRGMAAARVEVNLAATGAIVSGESTRAVEVPAGGSVEVRWPIATPRTGSAHLAFRGRAGGETDAVEVTKEVETAATLETVALYGETKEVAGEALGDLRAVRDDVGDLDVRVASTALVGVNEGMEQLLHYPYGCTEQLTSRLVPLVATRDLADDFGVALGKDAGALADAAVAKILANQREDGGFGWWPDSQETDPWVTAYALWGLDRAKRAGRPVPQPAFDRAREWLRANIHGAHVPVALSQAAFAVDVLATIGAPDPGYVNQLYELRDFRMPLFARALLAHAVVGSKMDASQSTELMKRPRAAPAPDAAPGRGGREPRRRVCGGPRLERDHHGDGAARAARDGPEAPRSWRVQPGARGLLGRARRHGQWGSSTHWRRRGRCLHSTTTGTRWRGIRRTSTRTSGSAGSWRRTFRSGTATPSSSEPRHVAFPWRRCPMSGAGREARIPGPWHRPDVLRGATQVRAQGASPRHRRSRLLRAQDRTRRAGMPEGLHDALATLPSQDATRRTWRAAWCWWTSWW